MSSHPFTAWLLAARPKTLPAAIVPVWLGSILSWWVLDAFSWALALFTLGSALCIQIGTNLFNDYLDFQKGADTEKRLGPQRVTASGALSPQLVLTASFLTLLLASLLALPLIQARGWPILLIGVPSLYFAFGYTGGPFPLAYRGMGEFFVLLFFGWIATAGTVFVQSGEWLWADSLILGTQIGLLSVALIAVNNLRDRAEDATTGKKTLAVRFGERFARWEVSLCLILPLFLGLYWLLSHQSPASFWLPLLLLPLVALILRQVWSAPAEKLNQALARCGLCLVLFAVLWSLAAAWEAAQ